MAPTNVTEAVNPIPPAGMAHVALSADMIAWIVLFVACGVIFWWGFVASARYVAHWRFGAWLFAVLMTLATAGLIYVKAGGGTGGVQTLDTWMLLWGATLGWIRFGWWRAIMTALGRCVGRLRLMLGARA